MAKMSTDELLSQFEEMTLLELSDFVKAFEEKFDVTAAAPVAVAGPAVAGGAGGDAGGAVEEKDEFDVILESAGEKKIQVIKEVRTLTSLGLKEAKDLVDGAPKPVLEKVNKEAADKAKEALEAARARQAQAQNERDYLQFQYDELEAARLVAGEQQEVEQALAREVVQQTQLECR